MQSRHKAQLKLINLPLKERSCHVFTAMKGKVLTLRGKLCDNDMEAHLTKKEIIITEEENKAEAMRGNRDCTNGMWYLNINDSAASTNNINNNQLMNSVYELKRQKDTIDYLSQAMWNPVPDT